MVIEQITLRVKKEQQREFEKHNTEWVQLMRGSRGFVNQTLMRNMEDHTDYRAEIQWVSREYRDQFEASAEHDNKAIFQKRAGFLDGAPKHALLESV